MVTARQLVHTPKTDPSTPHTVVLRCTSTRDFHTKLGETRFAQCVPLLQYRVCLSLCTAPLSESALADQGSDICFRGKTLGPEVMPLLGTAVLGTDRSYSVMSAAKICDLGHTQIAFNTRIRTGIARRLLQFAAACDSSRWSGLIYRCIDRRLSRVMPQLLSRLYAAGCTRSRPRCSRTGQTRPPIS